MRQAVDAGIVAPRIWWYELRGALLMNERRGRMESRQVVHTLEECSVLGVEFDDEHDYSGTLGFARQHALSVCEAAYLEVAFRRGLSLATLDWRLAEGATANGIELICDPL